MLEFIVTGEIPGIGFVITFSWVIALVTIGIGTELLYLAHKQAIAAKASKIEEQAI